MWRPFGVVLMLYPKGHIFTAVSKGTHLYSCVPFKIMVPHGGMVMESPL